MVHQAFGCRVASHMDVSGRSNFLHESKLLGANFLSGILSAHSLLVAKSAVELLVRTIVDRINQFSHWQSWVILLGLIVLALSQLYFLHRGLKLCSTSVLYPLVFCIYNIVAILDGLIYFRQTSKLTVLHGLLVSSPKSLHLYILTIFRLHWGPSFFLQEFSLYRGG